MVEFTEVERPKAASASERAKRVSEPTGVGCDGSRFTMANGEGERSEPDANERAQRVSEPPCCG